MKRRQVLIYVSGVILAVMLLAALVFLVRCLWMQAYQEELSAAGWSMTVEGIVFGVVFFTLWGFRHQLVSHYLLDTYGEECCKTVRRPAAKPESGPDHLKGGGKS